MNLREVAPDLYVGGLFTLAYRGPWDTIVEFIGSSLPPKYDQDDFRDGYEGYRVVLSFPMDDGDVFKKSTLDKCWQAVQDAQGPVLFHCAEGVSRTVSAMYAMLRVSGMEHDEAVFRVKTLDGRLPMRDTFGSARRWAESHKD